MKKLVACLLLLVGTTMVCSAQTADTLLRNRHYNAISVNGQVEDLSVSGDSLIMAFSKDNVLTGKDIYQVVTVKQRGEYNLVTVKMSPTSLTLVTPKGKHTLKIPLYGMFVFHFAKDEKHLYILRDGRLWLTEREAANTYEAIRLSGEYFNIWYPSDRFINFTAYPSLNDADSVLVQRVALSWLKMVAEHRAKKLNTYSADRFGADYSRDNLTKALINNHLSPLGSIVDFIGKLKQYHSTLMPEIHTLPDSLKRQQRPAPGTVISD
jgi:hypothetical protein